MIGNSFSISAGECLPEIVRESGNSIKLVSACIGGCSLERHVECLNAVDADPSLKPYDYTIWHIADDKVVKHWVPSGSVNRMLKDEVWDVITIQQASHFSWRPETYQPFADKLVARIRKDQPDAEIMIQQTWSYRAQDGRFNGEWDVDQASMFERLDAAYASLGVHFGFKRIPTGLAVQIAREKSETKFRTFDNASLAAFKWPDLPSQAGDIVGSMGWRRTGDGKLEIWQDNIHLNMRGQYLQACVWFGAIYGIDPRKITWVRNEMSDSDAEFLRACAYEALVRELPTFMN